MPLGYTDIVLKNVIIIDIIQYTVVNVFAQRLDLVDVDLYPRVENLRPPFLKNTTFWFVPWGRKLLIPLASHKPPRPFTFFTLLTYLLWSILTPQPKPNPHPKTPGSKGHSLPHWCLRPLLHSWSFAIILNCGRLFRWSVVRMLVNEALHHDESLWGPANFRMRALELCSTLHILGVNSSAFPFSTLYTICHHSPPLFTTTMELSCTSLLLADIARNRCGIPITSIIVSWC